MGARMHAESAYSFLPYDCDKVRRLILSYLEDAETRCGLVLEEDGRPVGMLAGYMTDYFFCDEKVACDYLVFIDRRYRGGTGAARLIHGFRRWAEARGARELCLGISTGVDRVAIGRFYEKLGFRRVGGVFKLRLGGIEARESPI